ncbi:hypothetical protein [Marivita sp. XM-24bin2]|jgi:hypothetical protein|uniref:hypothetical protein n=1 Tax=unclassified Marivita TaxID=2632480 RepID=UPI0025BA427B|nr:hypothetical protein [Marivita sp. XM-24bin2]
MDVFAPTTRDFTPMQDCSKAEKRAPVKGGPVLMADCITPVAGETLLSLLWKRWNRDD